MLQRFILKFGLLHINKIVFVEVLDAHGIVLLRSHIKLELAKLFVASLLQSSELKDKLFVALGLVSEVSLKLVDTPLLFIFSLSQVIDFAFVQISQILLH